MFHTLPPLPSPPGGLCSPTPLPSPVCRQGRKEAARGVVPFLTPQQGQCQPQHGLWGPRCLLMLLSKEQPPQMLSAGDRLSAAPSLAMPKHSLGIKGDSEGPLVCEEDGTWYLAGLVSWSLVREVNGVLTIFPGYPGVYNRPNAHNDWIQENVPGVSFTVVNFTLNSASPSTTITPSSVHPSAIITWKGAGGPSATIPRVLLLVMLLQLTL
ncbi:tissue-type plasminogen activator-like isoform X2 [Mauremys mutica]|uniref:tissue-type plasminogen activator-like isoform X2 n=1 Tax=Mauremys mutica TaxID=74926 RepID=UPI001D167389|nr:tissue-type plasminogen activator-like isoform X2 [Mauremys mutica]